MIKKNNDCIIEYKKLINISDISNPEAGLDELRYPEIAMYCVNYH